VKRPRASHFCVEALWRLSPPRPRAKDFSLWALSPRPPLTWVAPVRPLDPREPSPRIPPRPPFRRRLGQRRKAPVVWGRWGMEGTGRRTGDIPGEW
jgi:hypothetical protein